MLHARLKRSDYAHANLTRVDTTAAEALDGVVAVYTAADVPGTRSGSTSPARRSRSGR